MRKLLKNSYLPPELRPKRISRFLTSRNGFNFGIIGSRSVATNFILVEKSCYTCKKIISPKIVCGGPNFLCQTKNYLDIVPVPNFLCQTKRWFVFMPCPSTALSFNALSFYRSQNVLGWSKFFVPVQKFIYILWQSQTFCARQKDDLHSVKVVFVLAQKFLKRH